MGGKGVKGCMHGNCRQIGLQCLGIVVSVAWSTVVTYIILKVFEGFEGLGVRG